MEQNRWRISDGTTLGQPARQGQNEFPKYQAIKNKEIPRQQLEDNAGEIEVIAGAYKEVKGVASTFTPMHMMNAKLNKGGKVDFDFLLITILSYWFWKEVLRSTVAKNANQSLGIDGK